MMRDKLIMGTLAAAVLLFPAHDGLAQEQAGRGTLFERLDQNADGVLEAEEIPEERKELFNRVLQRGDENQDGKLTKEEFAAALRQARAQGRAGSGPGSGRTGRRPLDSERILSRYDSNGDGQITKDEVPERAERFMQRFDRNGDGVVTREEIEQVARSARSGRGRRGGRRSFDPERLFSRFDSNGDGQITKDEVPPRGMRFIERFDRNGDGVVTREELPARAPDDADFPQPGVQGRFERSAPQVGEALPEASGYDARGREFKLSSLKGHYSVLVFGCLT